MHYKARVEIPVIFGKEAKDRIIVPGNCVIAMDGDFLITRTVYRYETLVDWDDEAKGYIEELVNEKLYLHRQHIVQIGVGYNNDEGTYFVAIEKVNKTLSYNVESAENGNELLNQLVEWWQS